MRTSSVTDRIFDAVNTILLTLVLIIVLYPLLFIVIASISDPNKVANGEIWLLPKGFNLEAYKNVFMNKQIWVGYGNTIFYTIAGTLISLAVTIPSGFALARKGLVGKGIIMGIFVFTMFFEGGLIPTYIVVKNLGMIDTRWALIIPNALSVFYMIITRTFFATTIPDEIYEAAKMDGCSNFGAFWRIALPLSASIVAVMALFYGVLMWNQFFQALIYLNNRDLFPLQLVLRNILVENQQLAMDITSMDSSNIEYLAKQAYMAETMKYAVIFIASFPMLAAYPFVQKYFVKGMMIGSVKG